MLKASIALVGVAFVALAVGWVTGQDLLLYASIVCSALGGIALLKSTLGDRKREPSPRKPKEARESKEGKRKKVSGPVADQAKTAPSMSEDALLEEPSSVRAVGESPPQPVAAPVGPASQGAQPAGGVVAAGPLGPAGTSEDSDIDFRSRLAAALDTSSLENQLAEAALQDVALEDDDGLLSSRLRAKESKARPIEDRLGDQDVIGVDWVEEDRVPFPEGSVASEGASESLHEEEAPEWIPIDDLPKMARSLERGRRSRQGAARTSGGAARKKAATVRPASQSAKAAPTSKSSETRPRSTAKSGAAASRSPSRPKASTGTAAGETAAKRSSSRKTQGAGSTVKTASKPSGTTGPRQAVRRSTKPKP